MEASWMTSNPLSRFRHLPSTLRSLLRSIPRPRGRRTSLGAGNSLPSPQPSPPPASSVQWNPTQRPSNLSAPCRANMSEPTRFRARSQVFWRANRRLPQLPGVRGSVPWQLILTHAYSRDSTAIVWTWSWGSSMSPSSFHPFRFLSRSRSSSGLFRSWCRCLSRRRP